MKKRTLRLYTDRLGPGACSDALAPTNRTVYVAEGTAVIRDGGSTAALGANSAWQGNAAITISAGPAGARLLRWDLSAGGPALLAGANLKTELTLEGMPRIDQGVDYLMRCDRVDFPPGGVAFTHTHQGPESAACRAAAFASRPRATTFGSSLMARGSRPVTIRFSPRRGRTARRTSSA